MTGSIIGSVINIILDPVFIFGLKQGAAGAAIATVLGNVVADIYYVYAIRKKAHRLSVSITETRIPGRMIRDILVIGIPASITNLMQSFMVMMTNHFLLAYGTDKVAAMGIALKANMITAMILVGFAFGGQPLVGYNYGSGNKKRLKEILKFSYLFEMSLGLVFTVILSIFAPTVIGMFMDDPDIVTNGAMMLRCQQIGMMFMAVTLVSTCVCQSVGNALGAFILSVSRQGVLYVIALAILSKLAGYGGVLISQACADVTTAIIASYIVWKIWNRIKTGQSS
jgi:multidrug efflux pump